MNATTVGDLCRLDDDLVERIRDNRACGSIMATACFTIAIGMALYGAVFGVWRSGEQAVYAAIKLPVVIFSVVACSGVVNGMLAQLLGAPLGFRQVLKCILISLAITSALLGSLSPVIFFFISQAPGSSGGESWRAYWILLLSMTLGVGIGGIVGHVLLYRLLTLLTASKQLAVKVLWVWTGVSGFTGCQLSWMLSPFLAKPGEPVPFLNPDAFNGNFYEYVWRALSEFVRLV